MKISQDLKDKLRNVINSEIEKSQSRAILKVAHLLTKQEKMAIISKVNDLAGKDIEVVIDKSLLAGFVVEIGSSKYDYSLRTRILQNFQ